MLLDRTKAEKTEPAAIEKYGQFMRRLEVFWGYPECKPFFDSVMIDDRGGRQGFEPAAMSEIAFLHSLSLRRETERG